MKNDYVNYTTTRRHLAHHLEINGNQKRILSFLIYKFSQCIFISSFNSLFLLFL